MKWNWDQSDWPRFTRDPSRLVRAEEGFLRESGVLAGALRHLGPEDQRQLTVETIGTEAVTASEIEGEILDRASVQSSMQLVLPPTGGGSVRRSIR